jgi:hypothetical protein
MALDTKSLARTTMAKKNKNKDENLFKAILVTHAIIFLHLAIIFGLVLMVIFFRSVTQHFLWIFLGATVLFIVAAFIIIRRIKSQGKKMLRDIEKSSGHPGKGVEVSFLRGLVSLKFGQPTGLKMIENQPPGGKLQLEDPETVRIRELTELVRIYEKKLITVEEYNRLKNQIMKI